MSRSKSAPYAYAALLAAVLLMGGGQQPAYCLSVNTYPDLLPIMSGTDYKVHVDVSAGYGEAITNVTLTVGGNSVVNTDFQPGVQEYHKVVVIDSTHFSDGAGVLCHLAGTVDQSGYPYTQTSEFTVYAFNKAYVLGSSATSYGSSAESNVGTWLSDVSGYSKTYSTSASKATILDALPAKSMFFIYTHGTDDPETIFNDCLSQWLEDEHSIHPADVSSVVVNKLYDQAAFNIVFIYACDVAATSDMADAFGIGSADEGRAFLSFSSEVEESQFGANWCGCVAEYLSLGWTLGDAVDKADDQIGVLSAGGGLDAVHVVYGDANATLTSVYGGDGSEWYLVNEAE